MSDPKVKLADEPVTGEVEGGSDKVDYIEFLGTDPVHGTEFYGRNGTHTLIASDFRKYHDVDLGKKEVVWKRGSNGRFLVPRTELTPEAVEVLVSDPMFKLVSI